jgi:large subunit ribosomal protein L33
MPGALARPLPGGARFVRAKVFHFEPQEITADVSIVAKSRTIVVRVMSMAMTGYFKTFRRARTARPMSFLKYDPIGKPFDLLSLSAMETALQDEITAIAVSGLCPLNSWSVRAFGTIRLMLV